MPRKEPAVPITLATPRENLDATVRAALIELDAAPYRVQQINDERDRIDRQIAALQARRTELSKSLGQYSPSSIRASAYQKVMDVFTAGLIPASRRLETVVMLIHGENTPAYHAALGVGRDYLASAKGAPFIAFGHAFITTHGLWSSGLVANSPQIMLAGNTFCIAMPVLVQGRTLMCHIPVSHFAREINGKICCQTNVFIGNKNIALGVSALLKSLGLRNTDRDEVKAALAEAGYNDNQCRAFLAHVDRSAA